MIMCTVLAVSAHLSLLFLLFPGDLHAVNNLK